MVFDALRKPQGTLQTRIPAIFFSGGHLKRGLSPIFVSFGRFNGRFQAFTGLHGRFPVRKKAAARGGGLKARNLSYTLNWSIWFVMR